MLYYAVPKFRMDDLDDPPAGNETAMPELQVEEAGQAELVELSRPLLEFIEPAAKVNASDQRANGGAADDLGLYAQPF
jgi:hypothetical protein